MTHGGSPQRRIYIPLTCKCCGKPVYRSLYCSWRCVMKDQGPMLLIGGALWALAVLIVTYLT